MLSCVFIQRTKGVFFINFHWRIAVLQSCVSFCFSKVSQPHTRIYPLFGFPSRLGDQRVLCRAQQLCNGFSLVIYSTYSISFFKKLNWLIIGQRKSSLTETQLNVKVEYKDFVAIMVQTSNFRVQKLKHVECMIP